MLAALWIFVGFGILLWSLMAWGVHTLLSRDRQQWLGDLRPLLDEVPHGALLERWIPGWRVLAELAIDAVQWSLGWMGAAAPVAVWVVWGLGTLLMAGAGAATSRLIVMLRDKPRPSAAG